MDADRSKHPMCLVVPGLDNSGPEHWQSRWEQARDDCRRVDLGCWSAPIRSVWMSRLDHAIGDRGAPVILIGHSLGCLAIAWWASLIGAEAGRRVAGALLVAPPDVDRPDADPVLRGFAPTPSRPLPFPSLLVASHDDHYACFDRVERLARAWGSRLVDAGQCGHINAASGLGDWPAGEKLLDELIAETYPANVRGTETDGVRLR
ncbi:MAG: serine hydrolase family protein [Rhizorhabdus sp.]|nr:serine hydrolase family protein [Rhizorhabdus sp.]